MDVTTPPPPDASESLLEVAIAVIVAHHARAVRRSLERMVGTAPTQRSSFADRVILVATLAVTLAIICSEDQPIDAGDPERETKEPS